MDLKLFKLDIDELMNEFTQVLSTKKKKKKGNILFYYFIRVLLNVTSLFCFVV